jgi:hypothetical protein
LLLLLLLLLLLPAAAYKKYGEGKHFMKGLDGKVCG